MYIPDFVVEGRVVEIKGYRSSQWEAKLAHNPDVEVLYKNELTPVLDYVTSKYGDNFHDVLYETEG